MVTMLKSLISLSLISSSPLTILIPVHATLNPNGDAKCPCLTRAQLEDNTGTYSGLPTDTYTIKFNQRRRVLRELKFDDMNGWQGPVAGAVRQLGPVEDHYGNGTTNGTDTSNATSSSADTTTTNDNNSTQGGTSTTTTTTTGSVTEYVVASSYTASETLASNSITSAQLLGNSHYVDAKQKGLAAIDSKVTKSMVTIKSFTVSRLRNLKEMKKSNRQLQTQVTVVTNFEIKFTSSSDANAIAQVLIDPDTRNTIKTFTDQYIQDALTANAANLPAAIFSSSPGMDTLTTISNPTVNGASGIEVMKVISEGKTFYYGADYGTGSSTTVGTCAAWDEDYPPSCANLTDENTYPHTGPKYENAPAWCAKEWCYVDKTVCDGSGEDFKPLESIYFKTASGDPIYYSYQTCQPPNSWKGSAAPMISLVENHVLGMKNIIEEFYKNEAKNAGPSSPCVTAYSDNDYASCTSAAFGSASGSDGTDWPPQFTLNDRSTTDYKIQFDHVGSFDKKGTAPVHGLTEDSDKCIATGGGKEAFLNVARTEHDEIRLGYSYAGFAESGAILEYPRTNGLCDASVPSTDRYDPRIRPWYTVSVSGTKDVMIVIDSSGSMSSYGRLQAAKDASKAVLRTLTWVDFVNVAAFSADVMYASAHLVPATDENKEHLNAWIDGLTAGGSTNYVDSLSGGMRMLVDAKNAENCFTSQCSSILIFLSDGIPDSWTTADEQALNSINAEADNVVSVHTYFLGSLMQAQAETILKSIATPYNGVPSFEQVMDGGDLIWTMSTYYQILSKQMDKSRVRWIKYLDWSAKNSPSGVTVDSMLYAACATMLDLTDTEPLQNRKKVLGVVCMDINQVVKISTLQTDQTGYSQFLRDIENTARTCAGSSSPPLALQNSKCADLHGQHHIAEPGEDAKGSDGVRKYYSNNLNQNLMVMMLGSYSMIMAIIGSSYFVGTM